MKVEEIYGVVGHGPLNLSGWKTCSKNFKLPLFSRYQKFLPWGNSNKSKTSPKIFSNFFSTNLVAREAQSFYVLEGATELSIE